MCSSEVLDDVFAGTLIKPHRRGPTQSKARQSSKQTPKNINDNHVSQAPTYRYEGYGRLARLEPELSSNHCCTCALRG